MSNHAIIGFVVVIILAALIMAYWFIPYSPLKYDFEKAHNDFDNLYASVPVRQLTAKQIRQLPPLLRAYITNNGFLNMKMTSMEMLQRDVTFKQNAERSLIITYTQYNYAAIPARIARIESSLFGIPFEGFDYLYDHEARMRGQAAKTVTVFSHNSGDLLQGAYMTYLSEVLLLPTAILQSNISWQQLDDRSLKATLEYGDGTIVSGVFRFNDDYEMVSFHTDSRAQMQDDGSARYIPWTIKAGDYRRNENGINSPNTLQAIWHEDRGDLIYFDSDNVEIIYR